MKILILHGENTLKTQNRLNYLVNYYKTKGYSIERPSLTPFSLGETLTSSNLFSDKSLFVIDSAEKLSQKEINWININFTNFDIQIFLHFSKKAPQKILRDLLKISKIEEFKLSKKIFPFIDSFYPTNSSKSLQLLHQALKDEPVELLIYLLARHLRDLYLLNLDINSLKNYPAWKVNKLSVIASLFTKTKLKFLIHKLAKIDVYLKTSSENSTDLLDELIIKYLK